MNYSQITMPTFDEIARIERRAHVMRAEATGAAFVFVGAWIARRFRSLRGHRSAVRA